MQQRAPNNRIHPLWTRAVTDSGNTGTTGTNFIYVHTTPFTITELQN